MSDSLPPVHGLVAGKYQVLGLIGRGGMGSVWEGRHQSLGTRVAIKFIDPEYAESEEACARFVTEARAAATIQSKHAIQIFDHGVTEDGRAYMVMELLVGEPLDKRIDRVGTLPLRETARIIGHVCRALQRAHDAGIIHRDLKPENIFLVRSPDDDDEIAKVLDFGIAKIKGPPGEQGLSSSTKTGAVLGTPYYMSPEQARGLRNIDHRSDLWALGVIAHKCLTGILPFEGESVGDLLVKICTSPLPTPSATVPGLPPSFDRWFCRALEREPSRRFGSAMELAEALAFAAGLSTRQPPVSSQDGGGMTTARARAAATPSSDTGSPTMPLSAAGVTSAPFTASTQPARSSRGVLFAALAAAVVGGSVGVVAVAKLASDHHPERAQAASPSASSGAVTAAAAIVMPPAAEATAPVASSSPTARAPSTPPAPSARTSTAPPPPTGAAVAPTTARPRPLGVLPVPSAKPTTSKPSPNLADPGY
jgi:eukaryotic-like serine/threonine-protein kinase